MRGGNFDKSLIFCNFAPVCAYQGMTQKRRCDADMRNNEIY